MLIFLGGSRRVADALHVGGKLGHYLGGSLVQAIPGSVKDGHVVAKDVEQIRKGMSAPLQFEQVIAIGFELCQADEIALSKMGETGEIKRAQCEAQFTASQQFPA